jgi:hypothetical protein
MNHSTVHRAVFVLLLVLSKGAGAQVGTIGPLGDRIEPAGNDKTICATCCVDDEDNAQGPYCPLTGLQIPHAPVPGVRTLCGDSSSSALPVPTPSSPCTCPVPNTAPHVCVPASVGTVPAPIGASSSTQERIVAPRSRRDDDDEDDDDRDDDKRSRRSGLSADAVLKALSSAKADKEDDD